MTQKLFALLTVAIVVSLITGCNSLLYRPAKPAPPVAQNDQETWGDGTGPVQLEETVDRRWLPVYFAYDQSTIGATEGEKLAKIYDYLAENREFDLVVEGHCDERGSEEYNRALGERRAMAVKDYLMTLGLSKSRIHTLSFGEERPAETGTTEDSFRMNRRAELVVIAAKKAAAIEK